MEAIDASLRSCEQISQLLCQNLQKAQEWMKHYTDLRRNERSFEVGEWVYVRSQPYRQQWKSMILSPRFYGPFQILSHVDTVAYRLELPVTSPIHLIFHVFLLKKKIGNILTLIPTLPLVDSHKVLKLESEAVLDWQV